MPEGINFSSLKSFFFNGAEKSKNAEKANDADAVQKGVGPEKRQVAQVKSDGNGVRASVIMNENGRRASVTMHENPLYRQPKNEAPLQRGSLLLNANPLFGMLREEAAPPKKAADAPVRQRASSASDVFDAGPDGAVAASKGGSPAESKGHVDSVASHEQIEGAASGDLRPRVNSFDSEELYESRLDDEQIEGAEDHEDARPRINSFDSEELYGSIVESAQIKGDEAPVFTKMEIPADANIESPQIKGDEEPQFTKMKKA